MSTLTDGGTLPLHLEQWATSLAPLTDLQRASVSLLEQRYSSPITHKGSSTASQVNRNDGPAPGTDPLKAPSREGTPFSNPTDELALPVVPVSDPSAFLNWYSLLSRKLDTTTLSSHRAALKAIKGAADDADALLEDLERARVNVAELRAGVRFVEEGSEGLRDVAEGILEKMDHLSSLANDVSIRLSYFDILQPATALLSMPSLAVVTSPDFLYTLDRLDVGLEFMRAHPHYRDASLYTMRFEQCLTRAGTLIRLHFVAKMGELQSAAAAAAKASEHDIGIKRARLIAEKGSEAESSSHEMLDFALPEVRSYLYDPFEREAAHLSVLLAELAKRAPSVVPSAPDSMPLDSAATRNAEEFASLLSECRRAYFATRHALILPIVQACATQLEVATIGSSQIGKPKESEMQGALQFLHRSLGMLKLMSVQERRLYVAIFGSHHEQELALHLGVVADPLWVHVRPSLQRENSIEALSALSSGILHLVGSDEETADSRQSLAPILQKWVHEVQNRFFVRARAVTSSEITRYVAKDEELDYPARLKVSDASHGRGKSLGGAGLLEAAAAPPGSSSTAVRLFTAPPSHILSTWYIPLRRTLDLLSHLHQCVRTADFVPFAHSIIEACREVLQRDTATLLRKVAMGESGIHPHLFALRHLLLLREMSASVELCSGSEGTSQVDRLADAAKGEVALGQSSTQESSIDFSSVVEAFNALWAGTGALLDPRNLYTLAVGGSNPIRPSTEGNALTESADKAPTNSVSAPSAVELDIQRSSTAISDLVTSSATLPLRIFLDQIKGKSSIDETAVESTNASGKVSSSLQAEKIRAAFEAFRICAQSNLQEAFHAMHLYLEDETTVQSLVAPTLALVLQKYAAFEEHVREVVRDLPNVEEMRKELETKGSEKEADGFGSYVS